MTKQTVQRLIKIEKATTTTKAPAV